MSASARRRTRITSPVNARRAVRCRRVASAPMWLSFARWLEYIWFMLLGISQNGKKIRWHSINTKVEMVYWTRERRDKKLCFGSTWISLQIDCVLVHQSVRASCFFFYDVEISFIPFDLSDPLNGALLCVCSILRRIFLNHDLVRRTIGWSLKNEYPLWTAFHRVGRVLENCI